MRRSDSPFVLAFCGTLAIHMILLVAGDAVVTLYPPDFIVTPPPKIEMVDIEVPPPPPPPKQPEPVVDKPEDKVEELQKPKPDPAAKAVVKQPVRAEPEQVVDDKQETSTDSGGEPVVQMDDLVPTKDGVPVKHGPRNTGGGKGGSGGGKGSGQGSGDADAPPPPPPPVSVATIKTRALPKGDFGYIDAGRDYPAEARRLGIEGVIKVRLIVDATGKVRDAVLLNRLGHGLDELALTKARQIQFEPAKDTDDKPVSSVVIWTFTMTLPK